MRKRGRRAVWRRQVRNRVGNPALLSCRIASWVRTLTAATGAEPGGPPSGLLVPAGLLVSCENILQVRNRVGKGYGRLTLVPGARLVGTMIDASTLAPSVERERKGEGEVGRG